MLHYPQIFEVDFMMETRRSTVEPDSDQTVGGLTGHFSHSEDSTMRRNSKARFWTVANFLALFYVLASVAFPIVLFVPVSGKLKGVYDICGADGDFDFNSYYSDPEDFTSSETKNVYYYYESFQNLFSIPSLVAVTVPFGNYSFAQARWIDLAWDIGIGRIGQFFLVSVSYVVITRSMLHAMETTAVPHRLFANISFLGPSSMLTLWGVITVTPKSQLWKAWKGWLLLITLVMVYLIVFPTLVSAMTGYITTFSTRVEIGEASVNWFSDEIPAVDFILGNCSIFGEKSGCHVAVYAYKDGAEVVETEKAYNAYSCQKYANYSEECGSLNTGDKNFTIDPIDSLNISRVTNFDLYAYNKKIYNITYVSEHGQCQPGREYHWGFSYQLLFLFSVLNLLWAISMWSLWIMASGEYGIRTDYGKYRAAVDLVAVMKGALGDNMEELSNAKMKKKLNKSKVGIVRPDKDAQHVVPWDWTKPYDDGDKSPFKTRLGDIFNSIVDKMGYIKTLPAKAVSWFGWLPSMRRAQD